MKEGQILLLIKNVDLELAKKIQKVIVDYNIEKGLKARKKYLEKKVKT